MKQVIGITASANRRRNIDVRYNRASTKDRSSKNLHSISDIFKVKIFTFIFLIMNTDEFGKRRYSIVDKLRILNNQMDKFQEPVLWIH